MSAPAKDPPDEAQLVQGQRYRSFAEPLLKTTRVPIFIHPLLWSTHHLDLLHADIKSCSPAPDPEGFQILEGNLIRAVSNAVPKRFVQSITSTIFTMTPRPREFEQIRKIRLRFGRNATACVDPYLLVATRPDLFPVLGVSTATHRQYLRQALNQTSKLWRACKQNLERRPDELDPYDFAILLGMAQNWLTADMTPRESYPVKLISVTECRTQIVLLEATFEEKYLRALLDIHRKIERKVEVHRTVLFPGSGRPLQCTLEKIFEEHEVMCNEWEADMDPQGDMPWWEYLDKLLLTPECKSA